MVRFGRNTLLAALFCVSGGVSYAQRPLVFAAPEPTPAADLVPSGTLPSPAAPAPLGPPLRSYVVPSQTSPMPIAESISSTSVIAPSDIAPVAMPQAACCGATAAAALGGCGQPAPSCCQPAPVAPCCAASAPAPVTACGCAAGAAASFAALGAVPAQMYPGGPNNGGSYFNGSTGILAAPGYGPIGGNFGGGNFGGADPYLGYGPAPYGAQNAFYAGGYATAGYGSAVSGAWPTYYGQVAGQQAVAGFPMGYASGGTAGEHVRNPYYNDRRPWYTPGPGSRTVSIVW